MDLAPEQFFNSRGDLYFFSSSNSGASSSALIVSSQGVWHQWLGLLVAATMAHFSLDFYLAIRTMPTSEGKWTIIAAPRWRSCRCHRSCEEMMSAADGASPLLLKKGYKSPWLLYLTRIALVVRSLSQKPKGSNSIECRL